MAGERRASRDGSQGRGLEADTIRLSLIGTYQKLRVFCKSPTYIPKPAPRPRPTAPSWSSCETGSREEAPILHTTTQGELLFF